MKANLHTMEIGIRTKGKNSIAAKLILYFTICLLAFALVVGGLFLGLFRSHTVQLHRNELTARAQSIATTLSDFGEGGRGGGYGAYLRFLDDIAMADVWVIDSSHRLATMGHGMHSRLEYNDLPPEADSIIEQVFGGEVAVSESFSDLLDTPTLTVGVPILSDRSVVGVVLLHSPIDGINAAVAQGFTLLGISLGVALLLCGLLSVWLSKSFTDPLITKEAAEALRLEQLRRDFVANISHELKTPIAVVRGSLEALVDGVVTQPEQVAEYHGRMLNETLFLQRLVGDLLDLSRLQNVDFSIEMQPLSLDDLVDDAVRSASHIARKKEVALRLQRSGEGGTVTGDYGRLRQMLLIVLDNAVKFSPSGSEVTVTLCHPVVTVADCGSGIAPHELPYIFDRFYKSQNQQNRGGTGLGLAIAKQIAGRHDIDLTADNLPTGGAVFRFRF